MGYAAGIVVATIIYPLLKRVTNHPQIWLGGVFACSILGAVQAVMDLYRYQYQYHYPTPMANKDKNEGKTGFGLFSPENALTTTSLSLTILLFIVFFDTVYASPDIEDDLRFGVRGMAVRFRDCISPLLGTAAVFILV
ncbi:uncharacterized protein BDV17DRAFT_295637 [Aspergillus undulatus]|uniref:uncharacterized protein n=1 Tax=Aspergillus undulatus TaxID=1810928 RepID=UPI003CCCBC42